jgi:enamine deaminase RidA (YjgF/YER057c/UK114 family)
VTVYVSDMALWARFNTVYARYFGEHKPARTVAPVNALHYGCLVEMDAIAYLRN